MTVYHHTKGENSPPWCELKEYFPSASTSKAFNFGSAKTVKMHFGFNLFFFPFVSSFVLFFVFFSLLQTLWIYFTVHSLPSGTTAGDVLCSAPWCRSKQGRWELRTSHLLPPWHFRSSPSLPSPNLLFLPQLINDIGSRWWNTCTWIHTCTHARACDRVINERVNMIRKLILQGNERKLTFFKSKSVWSHCLLSVQWSMAQEMHSAQVSYRTYLVCARTEFIAVVKPLSVLSLV